MRRVDRFKAEQSSGIFAQALCAQVPVKNNLKLLLKQSAEQEAGGDAVLRNDTDTPGLAMADELQCSALHRALNVLGVDKLSDVLATKAGQLGGHGRVC